MAGKTTGLKAEGFTPPSTPDFSPDASAAPPDFAPDALRGPMRDSMRESPEESRRRAADRVAHLRGVYGDQVLDDATDKYHIDPSLIPAGWDYEWKRLTVLNKEDPAYQVTLARAGWEPVPTKRHPEMMPAGSTDAFITREGNILMERPMELTQEARRIERTRARQQVRIKEQQLSDAPGPNQFARDNKGQSLASVNKSYVPMPIPNE